MAKGKYVGVSGVARKVKKQYVGVDGVARNIKKGYIGVNGIARMCFSWDLSPVYLYNNGDMCISITGGWQGRGWKPDWATQDYTRATAPTVTNGTSAITATLERGNKYRYGVLETIKDIDLTGRKTLTVTFSNISLIGTYSTVRFDIGPRNAASACYHGIDVATGDNVRMTNHTVTLDVSSFSGYYDVYVTLEAQGINSSSDSYVSVSISSILLT